MVEEIDLVITYVNNKDEVWKKAFIEYCISHNKRHYVVKMVKERYSGVNWIEYQLMLVKKNMPFIRKVFLVVSNIEQVKDLKLWDKVEVVTHDKFIPYRYLPTFNSTTIEMFLPFINGLSEKFIYANDDMLPIKELKANDFFDKDKIRLNFIEEDFDECGSQFKWQCYQNCVSLREYFKKPKEFTFIRPYHTMTPMIKSHCIECYKALEKRITRFISAFRTEYNNNQYIYPIYEKMKYGVAESNIDFFYTEFRDLVDINHDIVCVNVERNKENVNAFIKELEKICE